MSIPSIKSIRKYTISSSSNYCSLTVIGETHKHEVMVRPNIIDIFFFFYKLDQSKANYKDLTSNNVYSYNQKLPSVILLENDVKSYNFEKISRLGHILKIEVRVIDNRDRILDRMFRKSLYDEKQPFITKLNGVRAIKRMLEIYSNEASAIKNTKPLNDHIYLLTELLMIYEHINTPNIISTGTYIMYDKRDLLGTTQYAIAKFMDVNLFYYLMKCRNLARNIFLLEGNHHAIELFNTLDVYKFPYNEIPPDPKIFGVFNLPFFLKDYLKLDYYLYKQGIFDFLEKTTNMSFQFSRRKYKKKKKSKKKSQKRRKCYKYII